LHQRVKNTSKNSYDMSQKSGKCFKTMLAIFYGGTIAFVQMSHCSTFIPTDGTFGRKQSQK
jgi:hypothetical protein